MMLIVKPLLFLLVASATVFFAVAAAGDPYPMFSLWNTYPAIGQLSQLLQSEADPNVNALFQQQSMTPLVGINMTWGSLSPTWTASFSSSQQSVGAYAYKGLFVTWSTIEAFAVNGTSGIKQWTLTQQQQKISTLYPVSDTLFAMLETDELGITRLWAVQTSPNSGTANPVVSWSCPAKASEGIETIVSVQGAPTIFIVECDCGTEQGCNRKWILQITGTTEPAFSTSPVPISNRYSRWSCQPYGFGNVVVISLTDLYVPSQQPLLVAIDVQTQQNNSATVAGAFSQLLPLQRADGSAFGVLSNTEGSSVLMKITVASLFVQATQYNLYGSLMSLESQFTVTSVAPDAYDCVTVTSSSSSGQSSSPALMLLACWNQTFGSPCAFNSGVSSVVRPPSQVDPSFEAVYGVVVNTATSANFFTVRFANMTCTILKQFDVPNDGGSSTSSGAVAQAVAVSANLAVLQRANWADDVIDKAAFFTQQPWLVITNEPRLLLIHDAFAQPMWQSTVMLVPTTNIATDLTQPTQPTYNVGETAPIDPNGALQILQNEHFYAANAKRAIGVSGKDGSAIFAAGMSQSVTGKSCVAGQHYFVQGAFSIFAVQRFDPLAQDDDHLATRPFDNGVHEIVPPVPTSGAVSALVCANGAAYFTTGADVVYRIDGTTRELQTTPSFCSFYPSSSSVQPSSSQACQITVSGAPTQCGDNLLVMSAVQGATQLWSVPTDGTFTSTVAWNHTFDRANTGDTQVGTQYCYSNRVFFVSTHHVTSLRLADGQVDWTYMNTALNFMPAQVIPFYDALFVVEGTGYLFSFYAESHNPQVRWTETSPVSSITAAWIAPNGQVIITGANGVASLDYRSGRNAWTYGTEDSYLSNCGASSGFPGIIRNGVLYTLCQSQSAWVFATFDVALGSRWLTSSALPSFAIINTQLITPYLTLAYTVSGSMTRVMTMGFTAELLRASQVPASVGSYTVPDPQAAESSHAGAVAGGVIGGVAGVGAIVAVAAFGLRGRNKGSSRVLLDDDQSLPATSHRGGNVTPPPPPHREVEDARAPLLGGRSNANFGATGDAYTAVPASPVVDEREETSQTAASPTATAAAPFSPTAGGDAAAATQDGVSQSPPPAFGNEA